jgi:hypothetical protein
VVLAGALQAAALQESKLRCRSSIVRELQRTLAVFATAVASIGGYFRVFIFVEAKSIATDLLSYLQHTMIVGGIALQQRTSNTIPYLTH